MWIKLLKPKSVEVNGILKSFEAGDWLDIGKQTAQLWMLQGEAVKPNYDLAKDFVDNSAGIVALKPLSDSLLTSIKRVIFEIPVFNSTKPEMAFTETLILNPEAKLRPELIPMGFKLLKTWQVAIPIYSYSELALSLGNDQDKQITKDIIRDLRVPTYDTRVIFIRRCDATLELIETWQNEKQKASNDNLAFHRAFYKVKPLMMVLPTNWIR